METEYNKQAEEFLTATKTDFKAVRTGHGPYFPGDKETRDIYEVTLSREGKKPFVFSFGQSTKDSGTVTAAYVAARTFHGYIPRKPEDFERRRIAPSAYTVLAALQKYDIGTFEDFCAEFGYDSDSKSAERIYFAVQKEYSEVCHLWNETEREALQEIQ